MQVALQQSATDPTTGTIDMECITTGMTSTDRRAREQLANELRELLKSRSSSTHYTIVEPLNAPYASNMILRQVLSRQFCTQTGLQNVV